MQLSNRGGSEDRKHKRNQIAVPFCSAWLGVLVRTKDNHLPANRLTRSQRICCPSNRFRDSSPARTLIGRPVNRNAEMSSVMSTANWPSFNGAIDRAR
jgi:hypothetical protein